MGRAGLEPAPRGLKVRANELRRTAADRNVLQLARIGTATSCSELRRLETILFARSYARRVSREARGVHPAVLTDRGLGPALELLSDRSPFPAKITGVPEDGPLPGGVEAAIYYVGSETLTNAAKHADASLATVALSCDDETVTVEIADNGKGGASLDAGSGLRGQADRVEALGGELTVSRPRGAGTLVRAELPLREPSEGPPSLPPKLTTSLSTMSTEVLWEPVWVLLAADGSAGGEMLAARRRVRRRGRARRRGSIIYRVIQDSRTLADRQTETTIYLFTEDGNRWRLPPPALEAN
jgi:Histidine kinase-, DNA gyrase B-, and HSP90-like ATPase